VRGRARRQRGDQGHDVAGRARDEADLVLELPLTARGRADDHHHPAPHHDHDTPTGHDQHHTATGHDHVVDDHDPATGDDHHHGRNHHHDDGAVGDAADATGESRFLHDVGGDAVNTASRMETFGAPGRIQVTARAASLVAGAFRMSDPITIDVKGKGPVSTRFLEGRVVDRAAMGT